MADENSLPVPPAEGRPEQTGSSQDALLNKGERAAALGFGTVFGGAGVAAVFLSENQAGTAALFLLAAALLLIGIQGTPLTRFGSGDNSAEFARRAARDLLQNAGQQEDPRIAEGVVRAAEIVLEPTAGRPVHSGTSPMEYEYEVLAALHRVIDAGQVKTIRSGHSVDFVIDVPSGIVGVEVKYSVQHANIRGVVAQVASLSQGDLPFEKALIVVGNTLPTALARFRSELAELSHPEKCEVVYWQGEQDDDSLRDALTRLL